MKSYRISYPGQEGQHEEEIITEEEIIKQYYVHWCLGMQKVDKDHLISKERCIEDFIAIHWAEEVL